MKEQDGIILIVSLVVLFVVSTLIIGFLSFVNRSIALTIDDINKTQLLYTVEAGIAEAMQYDSGLFLKTKKLADREYTYIVYPAGSCGWIRSWAHSYSGGRRTSVALGAFRWRVFRDGNPTKDWTINTYHENVWSTTW